MEITYEKYTEFYGKDVLIMLSSKEEISGRVLGCRNDEKGELNFLLVKIEREVQPVPVSEISYLIPSNGLY